MEPSLHPEAARIVEKHSMQSHPEGGFFVETFRSARLVQTTDGRGKRPALTHILFLLDASFKDGISRLHRVRSDEVWQYIAGAPLNLTCISPDLSDASSSILDGDHPSLTVPADDWQAAQTEGPWTLVGCSVGPGFEFEDFAMMKEAPETIKQLLSVHPHLEKLA